MTDTHNDPAHNEYLAAIGGMRAHTCPPVAGCKLPAIGDWVSGTTKGRRWSGRVQQIERGRMVVEIDGAWIVVDPADITH